MSVPRLQQGEKELLAFEELRLPIGERVKLSIVSPRLRLTCQYMGHLEGRTLLVSMPPKLSALPSSAVGSRVTVRMIASNRVCAFSSRIQNIQLTPVPTLFLEYPETVEAVLVRSTPRVRARLVVSLDEVVEGQLGGGWPRQALCTDISMHGACIEASDLLGEVGDELYMTARMPVGEVDQLVLVRCLIRNVEDMDDPLSGEYRIIHGVEFTDADEETRLVLTGFVYQQMLKERGALQGKV